MELCKPMLREFLSAHAEAIRKQRKLSQEQMAEKLSITPRAYSNLKSGKFCFSTPPLLNLLLMFDSNEFESFQMKLRESMASVENLYES